MNAQPLAVFGSRSILSPGSDVAPFRSDIEVVLQIGRAKLTITADETGLLEISSDGGSVVVLPRASNLIQIGVQP